ncbi:MAG: hypothetical protein HQM12_10465 [SAR324 cluster bacterium]|nr:hypothetical protein [SAR324 cluster bacterium]
MATTCTLTIDQNIVHTGTEKYLLVLEDIAHSAGWDLSMINLSTLSLGLAFGEAAKDIEAIKSRRQPDEISAAKIAGVITFRLVRWNPIHLSGDLLDHPIALKINFLAAFVFSLKYILNTNITNFPTSVTQEFQYTLARRHTNQETLGMSYDMLQFYIDQTLS